jgi:hypothetical protein
LPNSVCATFRCDQDVPVKRVAFSHRLVRLFTYGEIDERFIHEEGAALKKQKQGLEDRLRGLRPQPATIAHGLDARSLSAACAAVREWLARATDDDRRMALEALQISVVASRKSATITGVLPSEPTNSSISTRASA